jgi:hypothetical protein
MRIKESSLLRHLTRKTLRSIKDKDNIWRRLMSLRLTKAIECI